MKINIIVRCDGCMHNVYLNVRFQLVLCACMTLCYCNIGPMYTLIAMHAPGPIVFQRATVTLKNGEVGPGDEAGTKDSLVISTAPTAHLIHVQKFSPGCDATVYIATIIFTALIVRML